MNNFAVSLHVSSPKLNILEYPISLAPLLISFPRYDLDFPDIFTILLPVRTTGTSLNFFLIQVHTTRGISGSTIIMLHVHSFLHLQKKVLGYFLPSPSSSVPLQRYHDTLPYGTRVYPTAQEYRHQWRMMCAGE